ncbi:MAG: TfoX/Sxy family protein [Rhodobacteraceae bacterium]|nr:TfoX/Sxy family protein [Paracoccaceae bacterium]
MAYDETLAEQMRADLGAASGNAHGLSERKMFGGICFLVNGNMVCGIGKQGAMYRVGKPSEPAAMALPGVEAMSFTGRKMGGMVDFPADSFGDDETRETLTRMALDHAGSLPPK